MTIARLMLAALAASALTLTGCSTTGTTGGSSADGSSAQGGAAVVDAGGAQTQGASTAAAGPMEMLNDPSSPLATRKVYFDFDKSEIRADSIDTLRAHADFLAGNSGFSVTVEGHCDERGSREYNIGLGERRAAAIKGFLEAEGVSAAQINTISYGEERPDAMGHDESAWALNRRGVLIYQ